MRKITRLMWITLSISFLLFNSSCNDDPGATTNKCDTNGQLTAEIDGVVFTATSFQNTLIFANDPASGVDGRRCDIRGTDANGDRIILTFTNPNTTNDNCMDAGSYVAVTNANQSDNAVLFTYNTFVVSDGIFNLQSCDPNNDKQMTGTFSFDAINFNNGQTIEIRNGQFSVCIP